MRTINYFLILTLMFSFLFTAAQDTRKTSVKKKPASVSRQDDKTKTVKKQDGKKLGTDTTSKNSNQRAISNKGLPTKGTVNKKESLKVNNSTGTTDTTQKATPK